MSNTVRLITIGDSGAGKSSILLRYMSDSFSHDFLPTIGVDFRLKTAEIDGESVKIQIWDSAGQERFRTVTSNYYRGCQGILLVFDVTNEASFENVRLWLISIKQYADPDVMVVLVGNKIDLVEDRVVPRELAEMLAVEHNFKYYECSAKDNINVTECIDETVHAIWESLKKEQDNSRSEENDLKKVELGAKEHRRSCC